ncbi:MAG: UDP-N-acetylmuramate--L-alanine ligase [Gammaproteobacteria bacterium]|nr:UDP-N-acetylmuramate--L-alanine ligase [Gammaproteobacteria bacterium]
MRGVRSVHFVGIGGAGMCGIAEILLAQGFTVSGSDLQDSPVTRRLGALGVRVSRGHSAAAVGEVDVVVVSSAIREGNPEVAAARNAHVPVIGRGEMLAELMRGRFGIAVAGSHGKTTTACLVASVFEAAGCEPTYVIGGQVTSAGANGRLGTGRHMIAEADESDASLLFLKPVLAVITGVDRDHLDTYGQDFERLKTTFVDFAEQLPFYGCALIAADDPHARELAERISRPTRHYGFSPDAHYRASNVGVEAGRWTFDVTRPARDALRVSIPLPGNHNTLNALAAIAVATEEGVADDAIVAGLSECQGVERRFRVGRGFVDSKPVLIVDDYGHHPTEIAHVIDTVRHMWPGRRLAMVYQPHRFTRTRDLLAEFAAVLARADALLLVEVYGAGEDAIVGADSRALATAIRQRNGSDVPVVATPADAMAALPDWAAADDVLVIQGAGDVGELASAVAVPSIGGGVGEPSAGEREGLAPRMR